MNKIKVIIENYKGKKIIITAPIKETEINLWKTESISKEDRLITDFILDLSYEGGINITTEDYSG